MEFMAWPVIVLLLVAVFLLLFRPQIGRLIDRMSSVKLPGFQAEGPDQAKAEQQSLPPSHAMVGVEERLGTPHLDDVLSPIEKETARQIEASVRDPNDRLPWALRLYSNARIHHEHEISRRLIFGSQLRALRQISQYGGSVSMSEIKAMYREAKAAKIEQYENFSFEQWRDFLPSRGLLAVEAERVTITLLGRNFLAYLAAQGITDPQNL